MRKSLDIELDEDLGRTHRKVSTWSSANRRQRYWRYCKIIGLALFLICLLRIGWVWSTSPSSNDKQIQSIEGISLTNESTQEVNNAYKQRLQQLHETYFGNQESLRKDFNIKSEIPNYKDYQTRLLNYYERYFASRERGRADPYKIWEHISQHLNPMDRANSAESSAFPKIFSSSAKDKIKAGSVTSFKTWPEKNKDWRIDLFDDNDADQFIKKTFDRLGRSSHSPSHERSYTEIVAGMPKNIMRVDTFRYFKIFFDGGLYADSDTFCRKSIQEWPGVFSPDPMVFEQNDFILRFLTTFKPGTGGKNTILSALKSLPSLLYGSKTKQNKEASTSFWTPPSIVLAIEEDSFLAREDWVAMTFARPLQITQWAFMAQPFHPIFLDALGTILQRTEDFIDQRKGADGTIPSMNDVLEWTGPGMLTDAIFRYLGAIHGVHPRQLLYNHKGARFGDVILYPHMAFRSPPDSTDPLFVIGHDHLHEWW